jgi:SAM-dependent methyltransferase
MNTEAHIAYRRGKIEASLAATRDVTGKIESGEYALEHAPCFCGSEEEEVLTEHERYGIPARIVLCKECALIRINPRMTKEAYTAFYNDHYRLLNGPKLLSTNITNDLEAEMGMYNTQVSKGENILKQMLEQAIPAPKTVLDIGCHLGGTLKPFAERFGAEIWGVEIDKTSAEAAMDNGLAVVGSVDNLIEMGKKFDFIIMQDVIEHYTDLNELRKVRELMHKDSFLYIYTPGLFRRNIHGNLQIAHTYYFCANNLHWALAELGFFVTFIDEECYVFCQRVEGRTINNHKPTEWVEYVRDEFEGKDLRKMPPFSGVCKFTKELLYENMRAIFQAGIPDLSKITGTRSGAVCLVAGGPSIDNEVAKVRELQRNGAAVITILRMYPWCVSNGIVPDYVVSLDCTEDQSKGFSKKVPGVTYLIASVANPSFLDHVNGEKVYVFDSRDDRKIQDMRRKAGYTQCSVVNGGGSVAICSISLAFNLGFRDLHVFGLDCMVTDVKKDHADGIAGTSVELRPMPIVIDGKEIITTGAFLEFANQALDLFSVAHQEGMLNSVKVYGESLINYLWDGQFSEGE